MREYIFIFSLLLIIHPIFSFYCRYEGGQYYGSRACDGKDNIFKSKCPALINICNDREKGKYCYGHSVYYLKTSIYDALKKCNLVDEFDYKKCMPGFYAKRTCQVFRELIVSRDIVRECYPIHQVCKRKTKNDEDFKRCVIKEKEQIDAGNMKADIDCEVVKKIIPKFIDTSACYPRCKGGTFQKEECIMKCLRLRHYPLCCDIKNNDKYYVCKNYFIFDPEYLNGIEFVRTKKKCELCKETKDPRCDEFGWG